PASRRSRTRARSRVAHCAALRAGQHSAVAPARVRWHRRHRRRCRARASLPVYGGIRETDEPGEISKRSLRPPFMNRLYPAETRLKEGAHAHDSDQTGGSVPLPRVGGALSAHCPQYQGAALRCQRPLELLEPPKPLEPLEHLVHVVREAVILINRDVP